MDTTPKNFRPNFIYPTIKESDRTFGASISSPILRPDGDWRDFLPPNEDQNVRGVESSACFVEAQQATIATLQENSFGLKDRNYSARFNALLSNGTEYGGDPIKAALSIKKDGLIPQELMDWQGIDTWEEFHSWEGVDKDKCIKEGKKEALQWEKNYKIVAEKYDPLSLKYIRLKQALASSPCPISVSAWFERDGKYYKPEGMQDNHLVEAVFVDKDNSIYIRDTYAPYLKQLEPYTDFDFAMSWTIRERTQEEQLKQTQLSFISILLAYLNDLLKKAYHLAGWFIQGVFNKDDRGDGIPTSRGKSF